MQIVEPCAFYSVSHRLDALARLHPARDAGIQLGWLTLLIDVRHTVDSAHAYYRPPPGRPRQPLTLRIVLQRMPVAVEPMAPSIVPVRLATLSFYLCELAGTLPHVPTGAPLVSPLSSPETVGPDGLEALRDVPQSSLLHQLVRAGDVQWRVSRAPTRRGAMAGLLLHSWQLQLTERVTEVTLEYPRVVVANVYEEAIVMKKQIVCIDEMRRLAVSCSNVVILEELDGGVVVALRCVTLPNVARAGYIDLPERLVSRLVERGLPDPKTHRGSTLQRSLQKLAKVL
jgi:hypothetical protein